MCMALTGKVVEIDKKEAIVDVKNRKINVKIRGKGRFWTF